MSIPVYYSDNGTPYVKASELKVGLGVKTKLSTWFPRMVEYGFIEGQDFYPQHKIVPSVNGLKNQTFEWAVNIDMAKNIAMIQRTPQGQEIRKYLLGLDEKVSGGELLSGSQVWALIDICKVIGYFSVQEHFEKEHYDKFLKERGVDWWGERAKLFGYTAKELKEAMVELGEKYKNQKQAIFKLDRYELVRIGVTEIFVVMGKSKGYAKNVGNIAKEMAKKMNVDVYNDINTTIDFKTNQQNLIITDLKNYKIDSKILGSFNKKNLVEVSPNHNQQDLFDDQTTHDAFDKAMSKSIKKDK